MGCCLLVPAKVADGGILSAGPPPPVKARWRKQITALKGEGEEGEVSHVAKFKTHEEWKACFEPKKEKKKKEEEREKSEEERTRDKENREKAQKALNHLLDKVGHKITDKIVYLVLTFVAKLMEGAEKIALEKGDEEIAGLANALGALVCTFIFKHKGKHKFKFIRREMVAPELYKRINVLFDRIDAGKAEDAADKLALKVSALLKGEDAIARAVAAVSEMPLVVKLQQKMLESKGKSREEVEVSEEDIDKEMNNVLIMVGARLQAATSGQGTLSDYATCIIGVLLGGKWLHASPELVNLLQFFISCFFLSFNSYLCSTSKRA